MLRVTSLLLPALAALLTACGSDTSPEDQVRTTIAAMESAVEDGNRRAFIRAVAEDFRGQGGAMTREDLARFMVLQLSQHRRIRAQLLPIAVELAGDDEARATFRALVTGGAGLVPESGQLYDIETWWRLEGSDWRLTAANWAPVSGR